MALITDPPYLTESLALALEYDQDVVTNLTARLSEGITVGATVERVDDADLNAMVANAQNWRAVMQELAACGYEHMSLEAMLFNFATAAELEPLVADLLETTKEASNWHNLLTALTARGFTDMSLEDIVAVFPNFRAMAEGLDAEAFDAVGATAAAAPPSPKTARDTLLDSVRSVASPLTPVLTYLSPKPLATLRRPQPIDTRDFAETETALGPVMVGYTVGRTDNDGQLAFTFERTSEIYLLPVVNVLSDVMAAIDGRTDARKSILTQPTKARRLM